MTKQELNELKMEFLISHTEYGTTIVPNATGDYTAALESRVDELEISLGAVLDILDCDEMQSATMLAWAHGWRVDEELAKKNGAIVEEAYRLIGRKRPKAGE